MYKPNLPIAIVGAGPVGLAAAAQAARRRLPYLVLEAGPSAGWNVDRWGHVRVFSPWKYNTDAVAVEMLEATGWVQPDPDHLPTGREIVDEYLVPLAAHPEISPRVRYDAQVIAITRLHADKVKTVGREESPFQVRIQRGDGTEETVLASAVIDASGTFANPNPLGSGGIPAIGERSARERISYGVPDLRGPGRSRFAGKRVLVVGGGDSAFNTLIDLIKIKDEDPSTEISWAVRRRAEEINFGGGDEDALPERGALGQRVRGFLASGKVQLEPNVRVTRVTLEGEQVRVECDQATLPPVDKVIAVTGYRPDLEMLRELRLSLDTIVESPSKLAPLIDPNLHSCGTVPPHGVMELMHPEDGFYIAGMKSYGRAPTFLMLTGYEQVRSIVAALAGDWEAARDVQLVLPETGVCCVDTPLESGQIPVIAGAGGGCCGSC